ncbi:MAG: OmpA family protein [Bacteroidaceae bacterium]|nr:OmpA family protein [Bacteroidaceae bacterium]
MLRCLRSCLSGKSYFSLLILVFSALSLLLSCNAETSLKKGDQYFAIGEYYNAAGEYKAAYTRTKTRERGKRGERALKMAECYRRINYAAKAVGAYQNGIRYLEKSKADRQKIRDAVLEFQGERPKMETPHMDIQDSLDEEAILDATLKLARLLHKSGSYKDAIKAYQDYIDMSKELAPAHTAVCTPQNDTLATNGIIGARQALLMKQRPTLHTVKKEALLNSRRADFSPALLGDDWDQLYWTTTRPQATGDELSGITGTQYADIFFSKKDDKGKWSTPEAVEGDLNSELEEGVCCFSPDGKTMYFTYCTSDPDYPRYAKIYTSQRSDATWSKPQELKISKDTLSSFAHPAASPDGNWIYFVSDMPGGHGGKDIWRIAIEGKTLLGAECLPAPINTPGDELFPTFRPNGELYFSSDGHPGMGGLDIFVATEDSTTHRWTVKNLGYPMNSSGDDFGMTFEGPHNRGFFSSSRGDARGWDHLFSFECPEVLQTVKGWVYEKDGYELPAGQVYMIGNDGTNQKISLRGDGSFEVVVQPKVEYVFLGTCKGYLNHSEQLTVDTTDVSHQYVLQFPLASITAPVLVRNVFYEFNSATLTENSTVALDSLVDLLNENPNITIELGAHCDYRGNDQYNERLSQRRAESVVNYLIEHGIAADRLTPKGYGESRPKIVKRRIAEQYPYLHQGDTLTEAFIRKLESEEQQEACNALNRRTEFRVLRTTYGLPGRSNTGKATSPAKPEETETKTDETARTESDSEKN